MVVLFICQTFLNYHLLLLLLLLLSTNFFNYCQLNVSLKNSLNFFMELIDLCILIFLKNINYLKIQEKNPKNLIKH
jgi:hypothetical protein